MCSALAGSWVPPPPVVTYRMTSGSMGWRQAWALGPFAAYRAGALAPGQSSPLAAKYKETVWG